ncbi:hypothetical protein GCM10010332_50810 [Streptomyces albogriseolus]|nr:hypothetical protein GCM10010332_50810 [Streptomyces albogriseolus]
MPEPGSEDAAAAVTEAVEGTGVSGPPPATAAVATATEAATTAAPPTAASAMRDPTFPMNELLLRIDDVLSPDGTTGLVISAPLHVAHAHIHVHAVVLLVHTVHAAHA